MTMLPLLFDHRLGIGGEAIFSTDGRHRYALARDLGTGRGSCLFVMLNPSVATETDDDPTIRRCIGYSSRWGFRRLLVANVAAFRATDPRRLFLARDPIGGGNDAVIAELAARAARIVVAWGRQAAKLPSRVPSVLTMLARHGDVLALGRNEDGSPVHPLYQPASVETVLYAPRRSAVGRGRRGRQSGAGA